MSTATTAPDRNVSAAIDPVAHRHPEDIGDDARRERADGITEVAPEALDAERTGAPGRMRGVGNGGDQARIHHRCSQPEQKAADEPPLEPVRRGGQQQAG